MQKEFETIAYDAKLPEDERTEHDSIEKWRLLRHLSRLDLKHFSHTCLLYTSPSPRDRQKSRMPSSA